MTADGRPSPAEARLEMKPAGARRSKIDGGWWPRSAELAKELQSLVSCLEQRVG